MTSQKQAIHIDETIIVEQVKATHNLNSEIDVNATSVLNFVEDIFNLNTVPREARKDKLQLQEHIQKGIPFHVLHLVFEIVCSCLNNVDSHSIAIHLLSLLSMYPWHTKVVTMVASFAIICGKFKVASQSCHRRGLTFNLEILKQSLKSMHSSDNERLVIDDSIKSILDLTKLTIELQDSSSVILTNYWIARSVVAYASHYILDLKSQKQLNELSNSSTKIKEIMTFSHQALEAKRTEENYQALLNAFKNSSNIVEVLKLIFNVKNDKEKPILDGIRMRVCIVVRSYFYYHIFVKY
nr:protein SIEVE ELEMENT OCCLUSION B-like [Ipomoea batatas]